MMGVSTDGQICFGVLFEDGYEFPWDDEKFDGDIEDWWVYGICGYKNPFELYDDNGNYLTGEELSQEKTDEYYNKRREFFDAYPLPISEVNCCSGDYPIYILAVPETVIECRRGDPETFEPKDLVITEDQKQSLIDFCKKYCMPEDGKIEPMWFLSSYWG